MANLATLKKWQPGQSGNPGGRHKMPEELRVIRAHNPEEVARLISKYARMPVQELKTAAKDESIPTLEGAIIKVFTAVITSGDHTKLSFLLDRCIGKVPDMVETDDDADAREELKKLSLNELLSLVQSNLPEAG